MAEIDTLKLVINEVQKISNKLDARDEKWDLLVAEINDVNNTVQRLAEDLAADRKDTRDRLKALEIQCDSFARFQEDFTTWRETIAKNYAEFQTKTTLTIKTLVTRNARALAILTSVVTAVITAILVDLIK